MVTKRKPRVGVKILGSVVGKRLGKCIEFYGKYAQKLVEYMKFAVLFRDLMRPCLFLLYGL